MKIKIDYHDRSVFFFVDGIYMADVPINEFVSFLYGYLICLNRVHVEQVYQLSFEVSRNLVDDFYEALTYSSFPLAFEVRYVETKTTH